MPCRSSDLAVNAVMEAGPRSRFSERFSAVTMISVRPVSSTAASAAASADIAGPVCRIVSTARLSADAPHELALISAARPCRVRIPRLLILEDMSFPPFSRLVAAIFDELEGTECQSRQAVPCLLQDGPRINH